MKCPIECYQMKNKFICTTDNGDSVYSVKEYYTVCSLF